MQGMQQAARNLMKLGGFRNLLLLVGGLQKMLFVTQLQWRRQRRMPTKLNKSNASFPTQISTKRAFKTTPFLSMHELRSRC
jgi:hypothetical protein